jgi:ankyrin repeat protein
VNAANDLGVTPLWAASLNGSLQMVDKLLAAGANPNIRLLSGETPLMAASRAGKPQIVQQLLKKGADPNAPGSRGQTRLMWAIGQQHADVVKVLPRAAPTFVRSESWSQMMAVPPHGLAEYNRMIPHGGNTVLMFAARVGDLESARLLIAAGANVNDEDAWGVSATTLAAFSGYGDVARLLLEHGADPNAGKAGFTALHCAIMRRDEATVAALLDRGADQHAGEVDARAVRPTTTAMPARVGATPTGWPRGTQQV